MPGIDRRGFLRTLGIAGASVGATAVVAGALTRGDEADAGPVRTTGRGPRGWEPATPRHWLPDARLGRIGVTWRVHIEARLVALTFDDGPLPDWTPLALDVCSAKKVRATFNLVGRRVLEHRAIVRRELLAGHEVGNHTWGHRDLAHLDATAAYDEIKRGHDAIVAVTGQEPRLLRPPFGHLGGSALIAAEELGYDEVVLWSLQMRESQLDTAHLAAWIVEQAHPGAIILAHDAGPPDRLVALRALPQMIDGIRARGFEFVTTSQLLAAARSAQPHPRRS